MRNPKVIAVLSFLIASVVSRLVLAAAGFSYNLFSDPFDPVKLIIDFGSLLALFALVQLVLVRALGARDAGE